MGLGGGGRLGREGLNGATFGGGSGAISFFLGETFFGGGGRAGAFFLNGLVSASSSSSSSLSEPNGLPGASSFIDRGAGTGA